MKKLLIIYIAAMLACTSRDVAPKGSGSEYFPLKVGTYWVYSMNETTISQVNGQVNSMYDLKISITDSVLANGIVNYKLQRYKRSDATQPWAPLDTWSSKKDQFQAVVQEGNISYIRMAFPLNEGKTWNGNALNTLGGTDRCTDGTFTCENYLVSSLAKQFVGIGISYDDSVTIFENNDDDPIVKKDVRRSVYAKSIGLVYHEITTLQYCTIGTCIGQQIVENGYILKQTLKDYGAS